VTTRRQVLAGAALALPVLAAPARAQDQDERRERERRAVRASVAAEQAAAVAFEAIANNELLNERQSVTIRLLLDHAKAHAAELEEAFEAQLGEDPPLAPRRTRIPGLARVRTAREALGLAARIEEAVIATHLDSVRLTRNSTLLKLICGSTGTGAQHLVVLRQLLGQDPAPAPFERGGPKSALP
jgi:hypothetical protein